VLPHDHLPSLAHDILDTAFLLRWHELAAAGATAQELPPLPAPPARGRTAGLSP
jgi:hypothetical protein